MLGRIYLGLGLVVTGLSLLRPLPGGIIGLLGGVVGLLSGLQGVLRPLKGGFLGQNGRVLPLVQALRVPVVGLLGGEIGVLGALQGIFRAENGAVVPRGQVRAVPLICIVGGDIVVVGVGHGALRVEDGAVEPGVQGGLVLLIVVLRGGNGGGGGAVGCAQGGLLALDLVQDHPVVQLGHELTCLHVVPHLHQDLLDGVGLGGVDQDALRALHGAGGADGAPQIRGAEGHDVQRGHRVLSAAGAQPGQKRRRQDRQNHDNRRELPPSVPAGGGILRVFPAEQRGGPLPEGAGISGLLHGNAISFHLGREAAPRNIGPPFCSFAYNMIPDCL